MIIKEKKEIVGKLLTQGQAFDMLDLYPATQHRQLPFTLRDSAFEFYVVVEGFAQYIIASRGSFAIIPLFKNVETTVMFFVEGDEPIEVTKFEQDILEARIDLASFYRT